MERKRCPISITGSIYFDETKLANRLTTNVDHLKIEVATEEERIFFKAVCIFLLSLSRKGEAGDWAEAALYKMHCLFLHDIDFEKVNSKSFTRPI